VASAFSARAYSAAVATSLASGKDLPAGTVGQYLTKYGQVMIAMSGHRVRLIYLLRSLPAVQTIVSGLMAKHHDTERPHKGINGADPFVIAMAKDGGPAWKVVSASRKL
jgi:hypothetical protein